MANYTMSPALVAGGTGGATLPGSATSYSSTYGGIPNVSNPTATAGQAIAGDIGNLGGIYGIAGGINSLNENTLLGNLAENIPGYKGLQAQAAGNTAADLSGQLPADVITQLQQQAAERGVATGSPGSPNSNAAYLRALGLDSLQLENQGMANLGQLVSQTPQAPLFNPESLLVTPEQQQQAQTAANVYASAPNPAQAAAQAEALVTPQSPLPWWAGGNPSSLYGRETSPGVYHQPSTLGTV